MPHYRWWSLAWPGLCATLTGIGFGRFAYTALIPFLVGSGIVSAAEAGYLGAANLAGYMVGVLVAARLAIRFGASLSIRAAFVLTALGLGFCAFPGGFWWLLPWRALCGITGGLLTVLGPSFVLSATHAAERGRIGGIVFTGVGLGAGLATLVAAPLAGFGLAWAWTGLALGAAMAGLVSWRRWRPRRLMTARPAAPRRSRLVFPLLLSALAFGADGPGIIPHTLFSVDFIVRELDRGLVAGNLAWLLFGLGAIAGPFLAGALGDRIGLARALLLVFAIKTVAVALPGYVVAVPALWSSALMVGALTPAIPTLVAARIAEIAPAADQARLWGLATLCFALAQAVGAYGFSFLYSEIGRYQPLFLIAALFEAAGTVCALGALSARAPAAAA